LAPRRTSSCLKCMHGTRIVQLRALSL
jgi:hypothetical protein